MCASPDAFTVPAMDAPTLAPPGPVPASAAQMPQVHVGPQLALEHADWPDFTAAAHAHATAQMKQVTVGSLAFPGHVWMSMAFHTPVQLQCPPP